MDPPLAPIHQYLLHPVNLCHIARPLLRSIPLPPALCNLPLQGWFPYQMCGIRESSKGHRHAHNLALLSLSRLNRMCSVFHLLHEILLPLRLARDNPMFRSLLAFGPTRYLLPHPASTAHPSHRLHLAPVQGLHLPRGENLSHILPLSTMPRVG